MQRGKESYFFIETFCIGHMFKFQYYFRHFFPLKNIGTENSLKSSMIGEYNQSLYLSEYRFTSPFTRSVKVFSTFNGCCRICSATRAACDDLFCEQYNFQSR